MASAFPIVDRNHHISTASKHVLDNAHPATWLLDSREGPNDFGYDFEVQVAPNNQVQNTFRLQLKGTKAPTISADGSTLSIGSKVRTLNLYAQSGDEVMLVVAVVSFHSNGKVDHANSKVYWTWISDEIRRLWGNRYAVDLEGKQEEVTLKVPVAQVLTPDVDVTPYLKQRLRLARAMEDLNALAFESNLSADGQTEPLEQLLINVRRHPELLSTSFEGELELPRDGIGKEIAEGLAYVRAGRTALAAGVLEKIDRARLAGSPTLTAGLLSLEGKIAMQRRQRERALSLFEQAYLAHTVEKHQLPVAELRFFDALDRNDKAGIEQIAASLETVESDDGLGLLVRVCSSAGDYETAQSAIDKISIEFKRVQAELVLWSSQRDWSRVISAAETAIASNIANSPHDLIGLRLLAARAAWQIALSTSPKSSETADTLPLTGLPGLDWEAANTAWQHAYECLHLLKDLGWPANAELLAPIVVAVAGAIGKFSQALPLLREAASARPEYLELQENVELLAIGAGNTSVALETNLRQPEGHAVLVRRACTSFQAKDYASCLAAALKVLDSMHAPVPQTPLALALGTASAAKLSRTGDRDRLREHLLPYYQEFAFFADFAIALLLPGINSPSPLEILQNGVKQCPDSKLLATNLFSNLPVSEPEAARQAVELARRLREDMSLSLADQTRLINAHFVLEQWQDAELESRSALARFGASDALQGMLAIALEMQGHTGDAFVALKSALDLGANRLSTLRNYLGICLRLGRLEEARNAIERLLAIEVEREERLELLRLNALILVQLRLFSDALGVVEALGALVNREIEDEEGLYLILFAGLMLSHPSLRPEEFEAFNNRAINFELAWPSSQIFRRVTAPVGCSPSFSNLHDMLDTLVGGDSRARMREYTERERQIRTGEMPVPFVLRPSYALHYIGDAFTLWHAAKRSVPADVQLHLPMHLPNEAHSAQVRQDIPLLDLTALLVLHDLALYPVIFGLFKRIAIPKRTIGYISQFSRGWLVSTATSDKASALLAIINANLERIDQPSSDHNVTKVVSPRDLLLDYSTLATTGRWIIYSDDAITRAIATLDKPSLKTLSTLELMRLADQEKLLSELEVARLLAQLAKWNVGISVDARYLIAALDGAISDTERVTLHERLERFRQHEPFSTLARAIWHPGKQPTELVVHMAHVIAEVLRTGRSNEDSVAAIWAFWMLRLRVMLSLEPEVLQDILPYCLILVLNLLPAGAEARAIHTALSTVELVAESDRMSLSQELRFIERMGICLASLAQKNFTMVDKVRSKLVSVWQRGTHNGDLFESSYFSSLKQIDPSKAAHP